jgi:hypothetical protein
MRIVNLTLILNVLVLSACASDYGYGGGYQESPYERHLRMQRIQQAGNNAAAIGAQVSQCGLAGEYCRQAPQQPVFRPNPVQFHQVDIYNRR